jgi:hypothetical protein
MAVISNETEFFVCVFHATGGNVATNLPLPGYLEQCFSTAGPRHRTGPWHQLYRAARGKYFIVEILGGE